MRITRLAAALLAVSVMCLPTPLFAALFARLHPIEPCWAQLKQRLRALKARIVTALEMAIDPVVAAATTDHFAAYFRHCGYGL